jgi:catechol 2,3-dioxygenase-like lactoylglutathione lyase family enzyme
MTAEFVGGDCLVLFVADLARSRDFYGSVLGMALEHEDDNSSVYETENGILLLLVVEAAVDLLGKEHVALGGRGGATSVNVAAVDDVDVTYASLRAKGVEFLRPPEDRWWGMRTAHLVDPDGHVWEIHHRLT